MRRVGYRTRDRRDDLTPRPTDEEHVLGHTTNPAELAECLAPLDEEGQRAVRRYWEQVIGEEWVPVSPVPVSGLDGCRERRVVARVAAAGRAARVHVLKAPDASVRADHQMPVAAPMCAAEQVEALTPRAVA